GGPERQEGKEFATMSFAERLQWARERSAQSGREQGGGTLLTDKRAAAGREGIMPAEREAGGR
ncbi:MAG: hypothetical protein LBS10_05315, partial [Gracilibacteraceae bacterium]|nr:hypothetical protein [Gracilibacteraceae bacterium]